nr:DUF4079 family protein [uncultured Sphaerochaeta sp.]
MILWIHPIWQLAAMIIAGYVLSMGWSRFQSRHFKIKKSFPWKKHVLWGEISVIALLLGGFLGIAVGAWRWPRPFITGVHAWMGLAVMFLLLIGLVTGIILNRRKPRGHTLPLIHAASNVLMILLALFQIRTGWYVLTNFVAGL